MRQIKGYSIQLFGRGTWDTRYRRWGQLNYSYNSKSFGHSGITNNFRSIVWLDGDWHAYKMWPYLCYGGDKPVRYRRLSAAQTIGIYAIAAKTKIRHIIYWAIPKALRSAKDTAVATLVKINPMAIYRARKARKEADQFWADLGL